MCCTVVSLKTGKIIECYRSTEKASQKKTGARGRGQGNGVPGEAESWRSEGSAESQRDNPREGRSILTYGKTTKVSNLLIYSDGRWVGRLVMYENMTVGRGQISVLWSLEFFLKAAGSLWKMTGGRHNRLCIVGEPLLSGDGHMG